MNKTKQFKRTALPLGAKSMVSLMLLLIAMLVPQGAWAANHYDAGYGSTVTTYSAAGIKFKITAVRMYNYQGNNSHFNSNPLVTITAGGHTHTFNLGSLTGESGNSTFYYNGEGNEDPYKSGSFSKVTYEQTVDGIPVKAYFDNQKNNQYVSGSNNGGNSSKWCTADLTIEIGVQTAATVTIEGNWRDQSDGINRTESYSWPFDIPKHTCNSDIQSATNTYLKSAATCTAAAVYYKSCSFCGTAQSGTFTSGSALGHNYGNGSWSWGNDGHSATCTRTCSNDANHKSSVSVTLGNGITSAQQVAPSCTGKGTTRYKATATVEGTQYTATKDVQDIAALGHGTTKQEYTAATSTKDGHEAYWSCSRCSKIFLDETAKTETTLNALVVHYFNDGICTNCSANEAPSGAGTATAPYIISNQGNLLWFRDKCVSITTGDKGLHAKQTADIVYNRSADWVCMSTENSKFSGTYDGGGHTISGIKHNLTISEKHFSVFGSLSATGKVMNLGLVSIYISYRYSYSDVYVGAFVSRNYGTITNCFVTGEVSGYNAGSISPHNSGTISNCYSTATINTSYSKVVYQIAPTFTNCYNTSASSPSSQFRSGQICYALNGNKASGVWHQTIGTDKFPVLDSSHKVVYYLTNYRCDGTTPYYTYSNNSTGVTDNHKMTKYAEKSATCSSDGNKLYYVCTNSFCSGKYYKDNVTNTTNVYANREETVLHMFGHEMQKHTANPHTCDANGNYLYFTCSNSCCNGKYYKDGEIYTTNTYANAAATIDKAPGHKYVDRVCTVCDLHEPYAHSGVQGTCNWYVYADGEMIVCPKEGESATLGTWTDYPSWYEARNVIKNVHFEGNISAQTLKGFFRDCSSLTSVNFDNLNTAQATDMSYMFSQCKSLPGLDLSKLNTANVTDMNHMFEYCENYYMTQLNLNGFNTAKVKDMSYMFTHCEHLRNIYMDNWNTAELTNMKYMFSWCRNLRSVDLSSFNTAKVTDMEGVFNYCESVKPLGLTSFNTANVTTMQDMFSDCLSVDSLDLSSFNTAKVTNMSGMFNFCEKLKYVDLSSFNTKTVTDMAVMFYGCSSLDSLDLHGFSTENVESFGMMFSGCHSLTSLDLSRFNTMKVEDKYHMSAMIADLSNLTELTIGNFDMQKATKSGNLLDSTPKLKTLTMKSLPYLIDGLFNSKFSGDGVTVNIELNDSSVIYTGATNYLPAATKAPTYTRKGIKNQWGTLVVPFAFTTDATKNYDVYTMKEVTQDLIVVEKIEDGMIVNAGTPLIVHVKSGTEFSLTANSTAVSTLLADGSAANGIQLMGAYQAKELSADDYFISNNKFWRAGDFSATVKATPFRAYIRSSNPCFAKALSINIADETATAVETLNAITEGNAEYYDMNGHRINSLQKGVNIVKYGNGKTIKVNIK